MTLKLGSTEFDKISYDAEADVLYMSVEGRKAVRWQESAEGHVVRFDEAGELCGVTLIGARHHLDEDGRVAISVPQEIGSEGLERALAGAC